MKNLMSKKKMPKMPLLEIIEDIKVEINGYHMHYEKIAHDKKSILNFINQWSESYKLISML